MQDLSLKFQGSPYKFGKAAFCDIFYTQSKLYDHVLYKDLINFKDVWNYKADFLTLQAIKDYLQNKNSYNDMEKTVIIQTQQQQIKFLKKKIQQLANKNLQRVKKIVNNNTQTVKALIKQKQEQVLVAQSKKQLLQNRIQQLQNELEKNLFLVSNIKKQRQQMQARDKQRQKQKESIQLKFQQGEETRKSIEKQHKEKINKLNEDKLEIELFFKKLMVENSQTTKQQFEDIERYYEKKLQEMQEQKLHQSLKSKQTLNNILKTHDSFSKQSKQKLFQLHQLAENLKKELQFEKQKTSSLKFDIQKQDDILDKYEVYLKQSDENVFKLKQLLLQSQEQLEKAKISLEKNTIQRESFTNTIKICEEQARMWRQSYYLNKSRENLGN